MNENGNVYDGPDGNIPDDIPEDIDTPVDDIPADPVDAPPVVELDPDFTTWIADKDPAAVRKTFERFTSELESVKGMERELAPLAELRDNLQSDPGLVRAIEDYYSRGPEDPDPQAQVQQLEQKFERFQAMTATERELERLHSDIKNDGNPDFDDIELLRFAAENRIGSLPVAYKAMKHDEIMNAALKRHDEEIKKNAAAKIEVKPKAAEGGAKLTLKDLENMSDAEFKEHYRK